MTDPSPPETEGDAVGRGHLKEAALGGVRWITIARVVVQVSQFASLIVLAHLVSPAQYGHAAIALIIQAIVVAITTAGFGTPLVQRKSIRREHIAAAQAVVLILGLLCAGLTVVLAPIVVEPALGSETSALVQLAALIFLLSPIGVVPQALLQRRLAFRTISIVEIVANVSGALAAIALAIAGLNAAAIVLGIVIADFILYAMFFAFAPPPLPRWHWREIREIFSFGGFTSLSSLMRSGFRNVDYAIVGVVAGPATVGFYWRAFQLGVEYQRKISGIMVKISLPLYSRATDLKDMRALRDRIARANATIIFPLLATLIVTAPEVIPMVFGQRWSPAVVPTQILAGAGMCIAVLSGFAALVIAVGKPKALLAWETVSFVVYAGVVYLTAGLGVTKLCIAVTGVYLVQLIAAHVFLLRPLAGIPLRRMLLDVLPALVSSAFLVATAAPLLDLLRSSGAQSWLATCVSSAVGLSAYLLALRLLFSGAWFDFMLLANRLVPISKLRERVVNLILPRRKTTDAALSQSR